MIKKDTTMEKEAGWEFTLPQYIVNPFTWVLMILIVIALILSFVLVTKVTNKPNMDQAVTTKTSQSP